jgi:hypothetical protein
MERIQKKNARLNVLFTPARSPRYYKYTKITNENITGILPLAKTSKMAL